MSVGIDKGGAKLPDFERSINDVSLASDASTVALPRRARLVPVDDGGVDSRTEMLLRPRSSHDKLLRRYLQPTVGDAAVVTPARYRRLLAAATDRLRRRHADESPVVDRALAVLEEVQSGMDYFDAQSKRLLEA